MYPINLFTKIFLALHQIQLSCHRVLQFMYFKKATKLKKNLPLVSTLLCGPPRKSQLFKLYPVLLQEPYGSPIFCHDKDEHHGLVGIRFDNIFENYVPKESKIRQYVNVLPQIRKIGDELSTGSGAPEPDWTTVWKKGKKIRNRNSGSSRLKILPYNCLLLAMKIMNR